MMNKAQLLDRAELSLQLAKNLEGFDDDYQLKCLKLFTMITMCFIEDLDTTGVLLLRVKDTLTVAGLNVEELEAEELIFSAANAFVDSEQHYNKGDTH
jgi:hypothetical protein